MNTMLKRLFAFFFFALITVCRLSAQLPTGFVSNLVQDGYIAPMGVIFSNDGHEMFSWDKAGHIYISNWNGLSYVKQSSPVLNIEDEVGDWRDFGLLSICLDPDFDVNGFIYLYYVVDRHHLLFAGTPQYNPAANDYLKATIGRVTRYKLNMGATVTTDYSSRKILLGESITTGVPLLHESHMGGTLIFGRDKTLLLSTGDGASYNSTDVGSDPDTYYQLALQDGIIRPQENVGSLRSQMINSHDGKILRFDPNTGDGITSNPFFDAANPRSAKSRMWAMGFRNPLRMTFKPGTGSTNPADADPGVLFVGDVGWNTWEEVEIVPTGGMNCGWPLFEGEIACTPYQDANTNNQDEGQLFKNLCLQPTSFAINPVVTNRRLTHLRPAVTWKHLISDTRVPWFNGTTPTDPQLGAAGSPTTGTIFNGNCAIGGVFYSGTAFGQAYQNSYFFGDYGTNFIKAAKLDAGGQWFSSVSNFAPENFANGIVDMEQNPLDGSVFYVNINTGEIMRISLGGNLPPVTVISSNKTYGLSPLVVNFSSAGSVDPEGSTLNYLWDFGDGTTSTLANPSHTFSGTGILQYSVTLTVTDQIGLFSSKSIVISINNTPPAAVISNPANNSLYSILGPTQVPLTATVTDDETTAGMQYAWQVMLRHNNHEHREPVITEANPTVQISPIGCDGETYYYLIKLTVTDNGGLVSTDSVKIYPDCSSTGIAITNLTAAPQGNSVLLSWTNPAAIFDEIMIAAQSSTGFLTNPTGTNYIADANFSGAGTPFEQGKIVYRGTGQSATVTNLIAGSTYYFRVFTRSGNSWTGGVETSVVIPTNLIGSGLLSAATVNLTTEGTSDWAHWPGYAHKASGGSKISNYVVVGSVAASSYGNDLRTCSWSDGTPVASGSNKDGLYIFGIGNGFQITAPADLLTRTLKVYIGGWSSGGTLTAQLSDGSSTDYVNSSFSSANQYNAVYTLTYKAVSAGQLLTVRWIQSSGGGNVTLQGAALVQTAVSVPVTGVTVNPTTAALIIGGTQQLTATVTPANATNKNISWNSSNTAVATVNATGLVTAVSAGTATITVTTEDGNRTSTCIVTVTSIPVTGVTVNPTTAALFINGTQQLTATVAPANASNQTVTWSSSNTAVATVNATGLVTAVSAGTATITVTTQDGNKTATSVITSSPIAVTGVTVNPTTAALFINGTQQLTPTIAPANASNQNVNWSSSNTAVATVNASGLVTAVSAGTATITVTTQDGNKTATCTITSTAVAVTGVTVNPTSVTLAVNGTQQLTATVAPANATNKTVGWSSSNNAVATVNASGLVTGVSAGSAIITVTTQDGNRTATCNVTVSLILPGSLTGSGVAPGATVNLTTEGTTDWAHWSGYDHKASGGSKISNYVVVGSSAAASYGNDLLTCTWSDGTPTASGSNKNGLYILGIGNGFQITAPADLLTRTLKVYVGGWSSGGILTAQLSDGSAADYVNSSFSSANQYNAVYTLTYKAGSSGKLLTVKWVQASGVGNVTLQAATLVQAAVTVPVTGVTVNPTSAALAIGGTQQLTATIAPANASNPNISWSSSNTAVATVNASGLVTAVSAGTATITVTTQDGSKTATCVITASPVAVTGVTVNPTTATIPVSGTQQLTVTVAPANATNKTVSWSSSNTAVATVNASGLVTGVSAGTAIITVTTQDGSKTATSTITVSLVIPGSLTGAGIASTTTVNLTTEGTTDWAHWSGYDHKASGGSKISNYTLVGTVAASNYGNDLRTFTWSDGTPTASGSNKNGLYIFGIGNGFQITAPADLTSRTLKVYVGGWSSGGTLTAQLSDGSAANYVNSTFSSANQYNAEYTLTYKAGSAGKLLTVKWVQLSGTGNVTLQAATLVITPAAPVANKNGNLNGMNNGTETDASVLLQKESLSAYPNPFNENFVLNYSGKETGKGTVVLYDSEMRLIAKYPFEKAYRDLRMKIETHRLAKGIYFVQFNLGTTRTMKRLIKIE